MAIAWTEMGSLDTSDFVPANTGWQNYDIFTNLGVPKGAVALILMVNVQETAANTVGVRTDGSALATRYILLHEAEAGGGTTATMYVTVDSSTGLIETYCATLTGCTFYCLGYWTGVTFTEMQDSLSVAGSTGAWNAINVNSSYSVPNSAVVQVLCGNRLDNASNVLGVTGDSTTYATRYRDVHEAESASAETTDHECYSMCAKVSAAGNIYIWYGSATATFLLLGYFDSGMDYVERNPVAGAVTASTWTDFDLTSSITAADQGKQYVAELVCGHAVANAEHTCGARVNGSAIADRYVLIHEAETNGVVGATYPAAMDSGDIVEIWCSSATEAIDFVGYHKPAAVTQTVTDSGSLSDAVVRNRSFPITDSGLLTEATPLRGKSFPLTEAVASSDVARKGGTNLVLESFGPLSEAVYRNKVIPLTEALSVSDSQILTSKGKIVTDVLALAEALYINKALRPTDSISALDAQYIGKTLFATDSGSLSDVARVNKVLALAEALALTDVIRVNKTLPLTDALALVDVMRVNKTLPLADALALSDALLLNKGLRVTDTGALADTLLRNAGIIATDVASLSDAMLAGKGLVISDTGTLTDVALVSKTLLIEEGITLTDVCFKYGEEEEVIVYDYIELTCKEL